MRSSIDGYIYDTEKSKIVATNDFRMGVNRLTCGRSSTLYKTKGGEFFVYHETCWDNEKNMIQPVSNRVAENVYNDMHDLEMTLEEAFGFNFEGA